MVKERVCRCARADGEEVAEEERERERIDRRRVTERACELVR